MPGAQAGMLAWLARPLAAVCLALPLAAGAEAGGEYIAPALAIPALASRPEVFVPDGYTLESETVGDLGPAYAGMGDLGSPVQGVAQVYRNAQGRRALLLGWRGPGGFEASGWGFVLPCADCGIDLSAERNLEVRIRGQQVVVFDRSASKAEGADTEAELDWRLDAQARRWRLASLRQRTVYPAQGRAEESLVDYDQGVSRDASGPWAAGVFQPDSVQQGRALDGEKPTLDTLVLY